MKYHSILVIALVLMWFCLSRVQADEKAEPLAQAQQRIAELEREVQMLRQVGMPCLANVAVQQIEAQSKTRPQPQKPKEDAH